MLDDDHIASPLDLAVFVEVVKFARKVATTSPFKEIIGAFIGLIVLRMADLAISQGTLPRPRSTDGRPTRWCVIYSPVLSRNAFC